MSKSSDRGASPSNRFAPSPSFNHASYSFGRRTIGARSWTVRRNSFGGTVHIVYTGTFAPVFGSAFSL